MSTVIVEHDGPLTRIGINRPEVRNAVDKVTATALADAFRAFDADNRRLVAVLHGVGGTFCAGADLRGVAEHAARTEADGDGPMGPSRLQLEKPVIASVDGYAVAGGLELACWCDLRVVDEHATFGVYCRRWGVPLIDGGTVRLPRLIGRGRALDLILTGRPVSAPEALDMGLANRVVPAGTALAMACELAREIARFPQATLRADRRSVYDCEGMSEPVALRREFATGAETLEAAAVGAARFAAGLGRHGGFADI